jgi:hypothetical protein
VRLLGEASARFEYGDGRSRYDYAEGVCLLFLDENGLMAVTLDRGPAILWGRDLFALDADTLSTWLAGRGIGVAREDDGDGDFTVVAEIGLFVYFVGGGLRPQSVEVFVGQWEFGVATSH